MIENEQFSERVDWNGSKRSNDIQDASIYLLNVTFNDTGTYRCFFYRMLTYENYEYNTIVSKVVHLTVVAKGTRRSAVPYICCICLELFKEGIFECQIMKLTPTSLEFIA